jgi:hypothetical protein
MQRFLLAGFGIDQRDADMRNARCVPSGSGFAEVAARGSGVAAFIPILLSLFVTALWASVCVVSKYRPVMRAAARRSGESGIRITFLLRAI